MRSPRGSPTSMLLCFSPVTKLVDTSQSPCSNEGRVWNFCEWNGGGGCRTSPSTPEWTCALLSDPPHSLLLLVGHMHTTQWRTLKSRTSCLMEFSGIMENWSSALSSIIASSHRQLLSPGNVVRMTLEVNFTFSKLTVTYYQWLPYWMVQF